MLCTQCGQPLQEHNRFCPMCGTPAPAPQNKARRWPAVLALVLIFALGFSVFWLMRPDQGPVQENATPWFTLQDGILYFDPARYTGGEELTVPDTIGGQTVTTISDNCFAYCDQLVIIHLPETVTTIGDSAFYGCSSLRGIKLPESLTSIGSYAFGGCVNLEAVCIPHALENFGDQLFSNCHKLVYFFYSGHIADWKALPLDDLQQDSYVYCADGIYPAV